MSAFHPFQTLAAYVRFRPIADIRALDEDAQMGRLTPLLLLLVVSCTEPAQVTEKEAKQVMLDTAHQDSRCQDTVQNGLRPGMFDAGVVNSPEVARQIAITYFKAIFGQTDPTIKMPMEARMRNGIWYVSTTLPKDAIGRFNFIQICQANGRVLVLSGGQ